MPESAAPTRCLSPQATMIRVTAPEVAALIAPELVSAVLEASALVRFVVIDPAKLRRLVPIVSTTLYGVVDVDLATLIGRVVIALSALKGAVNVDLSFLNRGVRVLGGSGHRAAQGC